MAEEKIIKSYIASLYKQVKNNSLQSNNNYMWKDIKSKWQKERVKKPKE
tara:strand:- start:404 stop:550 length:147 start_codon:yes stop_codon:yes gene_type:complete